MKQEKGVCSSGFIEVKKREILYLNKHTWLNETHSVQAMHAFIITVAGNFKERKLNKRLAFAEVISVSCSAISWKNFVFRKVLLP